MKTLSARKYTVRELAEIFGRDHTTIKKYIRELFPGLMKNGVTTLLDEAQATELLERVKQANEDPHNPTYDASITGIETELTAKLKLREQIERAKRLPKAEKLTLALSTFQSLLEDLQTENRELKAENYDLKRDNGDLLGWLRLRNEEFINAGLAVNDREDLERLYRRGR
jgi:transposase